MRLSCASVCWNIRNAEKQLRIQQFERWKNRMGQNGTIVVWVAAMCDPSPSRIIHLPPAGSNEIFAGGHSLLHKSSTGAAIMCQMSANDAMISTATSSRWMHADELLHNRIDTIWIVYMQLSVDTLCLVNLVIYLDARQHARFRITSHLSLPASAELPSKTKARTASSLLIGF